MNHDHSQGGMGKHMLLMLICCLVPLALILLVGTFGLSLGPLQALLPYALVLMCPLMMIFMMRGMTQPGSMDHSEHHAPTSRPAAAPRIADVASAAPAEETTASSSSGPGHCH